jgi:exodeoxyribonuclease V beta subunit
MSKPHILEFDISANQPFSLNQHVSIQASAGTGKTYSLTTVVARLVAEQGLRADQLLLMTFTNEATAELKQSTRTRCIEALQALRGVISAPSWTEHMQSSDVVKEASIRHLEQFLSRYDEVTISTIHGFCQTVMRQAGLSGLVPTEFEVVTSIDDIIDQTITDVLAEQLANDPLYLWSPAGKDASGATSIKRITSALSHVRKAVTTVLNNEGAITLPAKIGSPLQIGTPESGDTTANTYAQKIADTVRLIVQEIKDRCITSGIVTYNDMINLVATALTSSSSDSTTLATQLARQYPVIMIDEFQDTDVMQWAIFQRIFEVSNGETSLVTVGDPKQAIYRFRGADVNVYLSAVDHSTERYELPTNYRSDKPLLDALHVLMEKEYFDNNRQVPFMEVRPDPNREFSALRVNKRDTGSPNSAHEAPLEIRYLPNDIPIKLSADQKNDLVTTDLVDRIITMLECDNIVEKSGDTETVRPVATSDIAVLVRGHRHGAAVHHKLTAAGISAVRLRAGSVFDTEASRQMKMLLRALAHPSRAQFVRAYALSWFGGMTEDGLQSSDINDLIDLQRECAEFADHLHRNGFTALYLAYRNNSSFLSRILSLDDGLRHLTDLDHIVDVLASHPQFASSVGPLECLEVLTDLIEGAEEESDEQVRRIETDQKAVRIMTIHASKGLQFPIVFLPTLFYPAKREQSHPVMFPASLSTSAHDERVIDLPSAFGVSDSKDKKIYPRDWVYVASDTDGVTEDAIASWDKRKQATQDDIDADNRRLFYVAMTRAQHKIVGYWYPGQTTPIDPFSNAMARALELSKPPTTSLALATAFEELAARSDDNLIGIELTTEPRELPKLRVTDDSDDDANENNEGDGTISAATFVRPSSDVLTFGFGRWSYSSITRRLKAGSLSTKRQAEQEATSGVGDESDVETTTTVAPTPFAWNGLPAGSGFGDAVHSVFDHIDPAAANLREHVLEHVTSTFASWGPDLDRDALTDALVANIHVTLDRDFAGKSLADLGQRHRLSEMKFDFPLPADDGVKLSQLVDIIVNDPNISNVARTYFEKLHGSAGAQTQIAGFMNGSIDAVFRIQDGADRFIVCDYKSNRLHYDTDTDPVARYNNASMEAKMLEDGYFFQALIYSLALHRYLKQRVANYDFDTHFGGVAYLFLRGLDGSVDDTGALRGYYRWMPSKQTVLQLDDIFTEELI